MRLTFLNREKELERLQHSIRSEYPSFSVLYGRRRCGKSRLLQELKTPDSGEIIYYLADLSDASIQRFRVALEISRSIPHFGEVDYPNWASLFQAFHDRGKNGSCLIIDEFPNLVQISPELPSSLQRFLDGTREKVQHVIICGSSQRMMHGLVLDGSAPLFGRAQEIIKVRPLPCGWITPALSVKGISAIESYATWGGVPRYWELASGSPSHEIAIRIHLLDRNGVLHNEPERLLADDLRTSVQAHSVLSLIGQGCHRLSEIASRLKKPATSLTRVLSQLIELEYVIRDIPFGVNPKSNKKTLYKLMDPLLMFWYRFVVPNKSLLELDLIDTVYDQVAAEFSLHTSVIWEELARKSVPVLNIDDISWGHAFRWWGRGSNHEDMELDIVAQSLDRQSILFGEVKWTYIPDIKKELHRLKSKVSQSPFRDRRNKHYALWLKNTHVSSIPDSKIILPEQVLAVLR